MNNKGIKNLGIYIVLAIIVIAALIVMFYLTENTKQNTSAKPLSTSRTTVVTLTTNVTTSVVTGEDVSVPQDKQSATPFTASLSDVIYGRVFDGKFSEEIIYNNAKFTMNCNVYNEVCTEGSALMDYNGALIPIFTFSGAEDNYLNFARDLYIIISNDYIFVTMNHVGVSAGKTLIFKTDGTMIGTIENTITGYMLNGSKVSELYPNFTDNKFNFYYSDNGVIKIGYVDITDVKRKVEIESVSGATIS